MKCQEVQGLFAVYLDGEITPSERKLVQAHLAGCACCQQEMAALAAVSSRLGQALKRRAARAAPSPQAWSRLEARLARKVRPSPSPRRIRWIPMHLAPGVSRTLKHIFSGGVTMRKGFAFAALAAVLTLATLGILSWRTATPVSAQEILDRAYAAQTATEKIQGIQHTRTESFQNWQAATGGQGKSIKPTRNIIDGYTDSQTRRYRTVLSDVATGKVMDAWGFDGTYLYSSRPPDVGASDGPMTIYRSPVDPRSMQIPDLWPDGTPVDYKSIFEAARQNPTTTFVGQETWPDGRQVYVLRSQPVNKSQPDNERPGLKPTDTVSTLYFDVKTYQMLESRGTVQRDGKEVVVTDQRMLVNEILPETASVAWDMTDLKGVNVVDDPEGKLGDQLPVAVSKEELISGAAKQEPASGKQSTYMLRKEPEGFKVQIELPPNRPKDQPLAYIVTYRNQAGDLFLIQGGMSTPESVLKQANEIYKTRSGLTVYFEPDINAPGAKIKTGGTVVAPDGTSFLFSSSLSHERVKVLAEDLVPIN